MDLKDSLKQQIAELEKLHDQELAEAERVQSQVEEILSAVDAHRASAKRYEKAIAILSGQKRVAKTRRTQAGRVHTIPKGYEPVQEHVDAIMAALSASNDPMTLKELMAETGISEPQTQRTVMWLRTQEIARLTGKRGLANLYAPMESVRSLNGVTA